MIYGGLHKVLDGLFDAYIGKDDEDVEIRVLGYGFAFERSGVQRSGCAPCEDEAAYAGFGKGECGGFADALAGAGDECDAGCVEFHE